MYTFVFAILQLTGTIQVSWWWIIIAIVLDNASQS